MSLRDLKSKSDQALASIPAGAGVGQARAGRPITAPGATAFMQPTIDALNDRAKAAEAKTLELEQRLEQQPTEVSLDRLVEVGSRKRRLSEQQFEELRANLEKNPLVHPIAVRRRADGQFEVVSGHNRVAAYRALGRNTISVVVVDIEESRLDRSAFYANLLQPSLPDYEKYLGFKRERERSGATQKALAREAGISDAIVSMLFAFEDLPAAAIGSLESRPDVLGMNAAAELARLSREGRTEAVTEAVKLLVEGRLTQKEAIAFASRRDVPVQPKSGTAVPIKIKSGRSDFCQYVAKGTTLRIDFKTEAMRAEAEEGVAAYLRTLAERGSTN